MAQYDGPIIDCHHHIWGPQSEVPLSADFPLKFHDALMEDYIAMADTVGRRTGLTAAASAKDASNARQQFPGLERLGHIIIGTNLQTDDLVDAIAASGQHDDRDLGVLPDRPCQT